MTTRERFGDGERLLVVLGLGMALLMFLLLEGVARLLPRPAGSDLADLHRYSEVYGWEPQPGAHVEQHGKRTTINGLGYRGREVAPGPSSRVIRLVLLGDSIAFGIGVSDDETFASLLDGADSEAVNLAVQGYGPDQSLLKLEREGLSFHPDVVVMNLCLDNDFADALLPRYLYDGLHPKPFFQLESGRLVLQDSHVRLTNLERFGLFVRERSRLVQLLGASTAGAARSQEHWLDRKERATADRDAAVAVVGALLKRMHDASGASGAEFLVLVHPDELGFRPHSTWINTLMRCPDLAGMNLVDMRESYRGRQLRYRDIAMDSVGHLSVSGHREVASILREFLRDSGLDRHRAPSSRGAGEAIERVK